MSGEIMSDAVLRRIAEIIGPGSAAAKALAEVGRRRLAGDDAIVLNVGGSFVVASPPTKGTPHDPE